MKIVFKIKEDDARNPGVIADCAGDNAGDSAGPTADGFETYGVTAVALITFIVLAVHGEALQGALLTWMFVVAALMIVTSLVSYLAARTIDAARFSDGVEDGLRGGAHAARVDHVDRLHRGRVRRDVLAAAHSRARPLVAHRDHRVVRHARRRADPGGREGLHLDEERSRARDRRRQPAGSVAQRPLRAHRRQLLGVLVGLVRRRADGRRVPRRPGHPANVMAAPGVFAFGLLAFGFLTMGPVTIAVDSYGPVSDNAQSIFELSLVETTPGFVAEVKQQFGFDVDFDQGKQFLEDNDAAGNTFKATAKPVLIGTAVVGATTLIFSVVVQLTHSLTTDLEKLSLLHPPFLIGLILGGSVIYWFSGAATQAVATGAFRAVEFIRANMRLDGSQAASIEDSKQVVAICTRYAQDGTRNIFFGVLFCALSFAFLNEWLFIGYLVAIALFGLFQANFMANAGGAWDNAKKLVETELRQKGTDLHSATVVGDTIGDPYKDTSSVAMNPAVKFTSLFGLLAVELAVAMGPERAGVRLLLAVAFFGVATFFIWRSFYGMRIGGGPLAPEATVVEAPRQKQAA